MEYYTILTDAGRALEAAALAGEAQYKLETCVLGDGTAPPDSKRTTIQNEVWRGSINTIASDFENPNWLVIETRIPPEDGGFTIREFGIYTDGGILFAIGSYPESYKPVINEGTGIDLIVRLICEVSNAASVTLLTDPSIIMASKKYVDEQIKKVPRRNVGDVYFHQGRSAPFGAVVADGGLVQREMYPDLWEFAQAQNLVITESAWQTQSTSQGSVGMYSSGDGTTTFRLPLMTDYFRGTMDPAKIGAWQGDAIRNITGIFTGGCWVGTNTASVAGPDFSSNTNGIFSATDEQSGPVFSYNTTFPNKPFKRGVTLDASRVVPTALENRPKTLFLLPCIHAYNAVVPNAQADMHAMMAALNGKLDKTDYTIGYVGRATTVTAQTIPSNTNTIVSLESVLSDPYNVYDAVKKTFVIKKSGFYLVTWSTSVTLSAAGNVNSRIRVNDVFYGRQTANYTTGMAATYSDTAVILQLAPGDVIYPIIEVGAGITGSLKYIAGASSNTLSFAYLGKGD